MDFVSVLVIPVAPLLPRWPEGTKPPLLPWLLIIYLTLKYRKVFGLAVVTAQVFD